MAWCTRCDRQLHEGSRYCIECKRLLEPSEIRRTPPWLQKVAAVAGGVAILALSSLGDVLDELLGGDWTRILVVVMFIVVGGIILLAVLRGRLDMGSEELSGPAPRDDAWHTREEEEEGWEWGDVWQEGSDGPSGRPS